MMPPKLKQDILKMPIGAKLRLLHIIEQSGRYNLLAEVCAMLTRTPQSKGGLSLEEIQQTLKP